VRTVFQVVPLQTKRRLIIIQPDPDNLSVYSLPHQISKKIKNTMLFACQSQNFELKKKSKIQKVRLKATKFFSTLNVLSTISSSIEIKKKLGLTD